ncbi:uncharacterized protein LOC120694459 [Panicum virgatum]|uniref:Phorbol-ester/DAG-type domain-containing protein n=1 Tax=Panicum virgatum TaxID=38727 RepID=A0A8T0WLW8_PANVG|nr:uncharacterized protein LOC120694459 [Panicum virgatum]KAG2646746.1 hypothetical protein PVAP13_2KG529100 [Panicum virgatum]
MADDQPRRFFDPLHQLVKTQYGPEAGASCDICLSKLAGLGGHSCSACNIDLHDACAGYFKETTSFFAHPWHTLKLSRIPHPSASSPVRWSCDLCLEECRPGSFVYRCIQCLFDVHPLCTMLPQTIRSPLHPEHDLRMVPSGGNYCSACEKSLPVWRYVCGGHCVVRLHIDCVSGETTTSAGQGDAAAADATGANGSHTAGRRPRRRTVIAKFLLKTSFRIAVNAATGGLGSPVLDVLAAIFN